MWSSVSVQLETYMDLTAARQKLVAANIANASTPGYRTKDIDFHSEYTRSLDGAGGSPRVVQPDGLSAGNDGNDVSLEREARLLAENALRFNAASQLWRAELRQIKLAIGTGRGG
jgi:flagellar basal-body rod protein FlgB